MTAPDDIPPPEGETPAEVKVKRTLRQTAAFVAGVAVSVLAALLLLVFVGGRPKAVLGWIDTGGVRTPIYICELDPAKLRKAAATKNTYYYDEITIDPRYEPAFPARAAKHAGR